MAETPGNHYYTEYRRTVIKLLPTAPKESVEASTLLWNAKNPLYVQRLPWILPSELDVFDLRKDLFDDVFPRFSQSLLLDTLQLLKEEPKPLILSQRAQQQLANSRIMTKKVGQSGGNSESVIDRRAMPGEVREQARIWEPIASLTSDKTLKAPTQPGVEQDETSLALVQPSDLDYIALGPTAQARVVSKNGAYELEVTNRLVTSNTTNVNRLTVSLQPGKPIILGNFGNPDLVMSPIYLDNTTTGLAEIRSEMQEAMGVNLPFSRSEVRNVLLLNSDGNLTVEHIGRSGETEVKVKAPQSPALATAA